MTIKRNIAGKLATNEHGNVVVVVVAVKYNFTGSFDGNANNKSYWLLCFSPHFQNAGSQSKKMMMVWWKVPSSKLYKRPSESGS